MRRAAAAVRSESSSDHPRSSHRRPPDSSIPQPAATSSNTTVTSNANNTNTGSNNRRPLRRKKKKGSSSTFRDAGSLAFLVLVALAIVGLLGLGITVLVRPNSPSPAAKKKKNNNNNQQRKTTQKQRRKNHLRLPFGLIDQALCTNEADCADGKDQDDDPSSPRKPFTPAFPIMTRHASVSLSTAALNMCTQTLWHTIETTTIVLPEGETFIHTGDIDDLWLRDSAAQIHPLLLPVFNGSALIQLDPKLDRIVSGLIKRTARYIRHDPYANAFRIDDTYVFSEAQKRMGRHDLISTWNYELDSACYYMRLLYYYWKQAPHPNQVLKLPAVREAVEIMVDLWIAEQKHELDQYPTGPLFDCQNCNKPYRYPGLPRDGKGTPTNASAGLTWTGFRPSDDECRYGYLVPANMFAVAVLEYMVEMAKDLWKAPTLAQKAQTLANEIQRGIEEHAIVDEPRHGLIYAYEVDGLGHHISMDDANVPSLLSIPYLGYTKYDRKIYENTRRFILSHENPTYRMGHNSLTGKIEGYGSPHMSARIENNIWPMSLAVQGLTSTNVEEKIRLVEQLVQASAGTGWMHESFDVNDPHRFTRSWFCWADSLFAELVLSLTDACPDPSHKYKVLEWRDPVQVPGGALAAK